MISAWIRQFCSPFSSQIKLYVYYILNPSVNFKTWLFSTKVIQGSTVGHQQSVIWQNKNKIQFKLAYSMCNKTRLKSLLKSKSLESDEKLWLKVTRSSSFQRVNESNLNGGLSWTTPYNSRAKDTQFLTGWVFLRCNVRLIGRGGLGGNSLAIVIVCRGIGGGIYDW